jgi:DNA-binding transcriptional regulator LsrR (DeoR family)
MYVRPCIMYEIENRYQLDAIIVIYYQKLQSDTNLHTVHKTTHQLLGTTITTPNAEHHMR